MSQLHIQASSSVSLHGEPCKQGHRPKIDSERTLCTYFLQHVHVWGKIKQHCAALDEVLTHDHWISNPMFCHESAILRQPRRLGYRFYRQGKEMQILNHTPYCCSATQENVAHLHTHACTQAHAHRAKQRRGAKERETLRKPYEELR